LSTQVFNKEEVYPRVTIDDDLPDLLILQTDDGMHEFSANVGFGEIFATQARLLPHLGHHRLHGIILACGPGIKRGYRMRGARIYDLVPTILHMFGLPIPNDIDGRVLTEMFEEGLEFSERKTSYVDISYYGEGFETESVEAAEEKRESQEEEKIKERLRSLGYF